MMPKLYPYLRMGFDGTKETLGCRGLRDRTYSTVAGSRRQSYPQEYFGIFQPEEIGEISGRKGAYKLKGRGPFNEGGSAEGAR